MAYIRVQPAVLQGEATHVSGASAGLRSAAAQALTAAGSLSDPIARAQLSGRVNGLASDGNREAQNVASLLDTMGTTLSTRAVAFLAADGASASGMLGAFQSLVGMTNSFVDFCRDLAHLPKDALGSILSLGGLLGQGIQAAGLITLLAPGAQGVPVLGACFKGLTFPNLTRPSWWPRWLWPFGSGRGQESEENRGEIGSPEEPEPSTTHRGSLLEAPVVPPTALPDLAAARAQLAALPAMQSPWTQVDAPFNSEVGSRSVLTYSAVIDQFDPENSFPERYRKGGAGLENTRCNIFAGDVMRAMGAPFPEKSATDHMTVAFPKLYDWLNEQNDGWRRLDPSNPADLKVLHGHLAAGKPAVLANPIHIAVLRPEPLPSDRSHLDIADFHIAQAGLVNVNDTTLRAKPTFGVPGDGVYIQPYIYIHD